MVIMVFGYFFHAIIGAIVDVFGGSSSSQALFYGVMVVPIALFFGSSGFSLYGVVLFGDWNQVSELTRKFSLWK